MDSSEMTSEPPETTAMVSQKRERSESPLFVSQDVTTPPPERDPKRTKLDPITQPPNDRVTASQTSESTPNPAPTPTPTEQSSSIQSSSCIPSVTSDVTSTSESVSNLHLNDLALQFQNIRLPANCPRLAAYHPLCKKTESDIAQLCIDFTSAYRQCKNAGFLSDELDMICGQLHEYRDVTQHYPPTKPVALAGPMGAGKSRTINSILGQRGLALDSDASDRGTNVVHEYLGPEAGQKTKYRVKVVYYSASQLSARSAKTIHPIYQYLSLQDGGDDEVEDMEEDDLRAKFHNSLNFFHTTLCDNEAFDNRETTKAFFKKYVEEEVVDILDGFFARFKASRKVVNDAESYDASDENELAQIFAKVSKPQEMETQQGHPWPIIEKMQVRVRDSDILKMGALVADTPGVADSDELVVSSTTMYLQSVGIVLIVSPILRTQRLVDLNDILRTCLLCGKAENTYLVMTKIDQKDALKDHEKAALKPVFRQAIDAAEVEQVKLRQERASLEIKRDSYMKEFPTDPDAAADFRKTFARLSELPKLIKQQEDQVFQVTVKARNVDTEEALKGKFRELSKSGRAPDLKTLFVSNEEYQLLAEHKPARLDEEATGIPGIQRIIYEVPALDKFGMLQSIVEDDVAVKFRGAILSLTKTKLERKVEVEARLARALKEKSTLAYSLQQSIERVFEQVVAEAFDTQEVEWQKKAKRLISEWETYNAQNFMTFCRHAGVWSPIKRGEKRDKTKKKREKISWNGLIQEIFSSDTAKFFDDFWYGFDEAVNCADSNVRVWLDKVEDTLKACPEFQGVSNTEMFYEKLHSTRDITQKAVRQITRTLRRELMSVYHKINLQDKVEANFVDEAMRATYSEGAKINSKDFAIATADGKKFKMTAAAGAHNARVNIVRRKLMGTGSAPATGDANDGDDGQQRGAQLSVFQSVFEQVKDRLGATLEAAISEVFHKLTATADDITGDFNLRYTVEEVEDTNDPQAKQ